MRGDVHNGRLSMRRSKRGDVAAMPPLRRPESDRGEDSSVVTQPTNPQPYPAPQPQPPAPKKKGGWWRWVPFGIVIALAIIGIASIGGGDDPAAPTADSDSSVSKETGPADSPAIKTYRIGEKATDHDYQFTVTKIKCGVRRIGDSYNNEKAQGQFCLVSLRVKNVGDKAINFSDDNQALIDTKGKEYSPDDDAWFYLEDAEILPEINPGNALKTTVPFDIGKKAKPDHLLLKAGYWGASEGVKVKL